MSLVRISAIVAAVNLNLVSCGLYSWVNCWFFHMAVQFEWMQIQNWYDIVWHQYRIEARMASFLHFSNSSTVPMFEHFPLYFSPPLIKTTSPTSIFISFVLCIILCLSLRNRKYSFSISSKLSLWNYWYNIGFFYFRVSSSSRSSGIVIRCTNNKVLDVKTDI